MQDNAFTNKVKQLWAFIKRMAVRAWKYLKVAKMEWIVMIGLFAADLISKAIVDATVARGETVVIIPKFLNVHSIYNYAAAFGASFIKDLLGGIGARIFFSVFAVAASVAFILVLIKNKGKSKWFRVSIAMFVAGAMGNCIDRMFLGYVRDFIEFEYFGLTIWGRTTWYVFNIADAELVVGVIMIVIYFLFMYKDTGKKKEQAELLTDELGDVDPDTLDQTAAVKANKDITSAETDGEGSKIDNPASGTEELPTDGDGPCEAKVQSEGSSDISVVENVAENTQDGEKNGETAAELGTDEKAEADVKSDSDAVGENTCAADAISGVEPKSTRSTARRAPSAKIDAGQAAKRKAPVARKARDSRSAGGASVEGSNKNGKDEVAPE